MLLVPSKRAFQASRDEEFIQENWEEDTEESARRRQQILPILEAPKGVQNTGTRASA